MQILQISIKSPKASPPPIFCLFLDHIFCCPTLWQLATVVNIKNPHAWMTALRLRSLPLLKLNPTNRHKSNLTNVQESKLNICLHRFWFEKLRSIHLHLKPFLLWLQELAHTWKVVRKVYAIFSPSPDIADHLKHAWCIKFALLQFIQSYVFTQSPALCSS